MSDIQANTVYGTLKLLILQTLGEGESLHGLQVRDRIARATNDVLTIEEGALYPALRRLEADGLVRSEWRMSEKRRRARYYTLTGKGRKRLARERSGWLEHVRAVAQVLGVSPGGAA